MTNFKAENIITRRNDIPGDGVERTSFNLYANGELCGRLTMRAEAFEEFTARMRSVEMPE